MDKVYKPVPDVEALRYHGTPEKPDIKIFVSHRIDQDSETIDNPLYIPVRCGAVYDQRENVQMLGDDTGDNISEKKPFLSELTVQYWVWKNVKADYYGLCHYRRYWNFSQHEYKTDEYFNVRDQYINAKTIKKYGLEEMPMRNIIESSDVVVAKHIDVSKLPGAFKNIATQFSQSNPFLLARDVKILNDVLKEKAPDFCDVADKYLNGTDAYFCCLGIMKADIFDEYCSWLYPILEELEKRLDTKYYSEEALRTTAHLAERLYGIYITYLQTRNDIKVTELQSVLFLCPDRLTDIFPAFQKDNVPIVVASSNEYVPFLATLLKSIQINSSVNRNYDIIVLSNNIHKENKAILSEMLHYHNFSIRFINADRYINGRNFHTALHITPMTYLRLAMLDVLKHYEKAIYLDCDIVVNTDIGELFDTDLKGYFIAGAVDTVMAGWYNTKDNVQIKYNAEVLGLKRKFEYFNAGVILVNISEFSKQYTSDELMDIASSKKWKWFDQDVLNIICEGHTKLLDNSWNVMAHQHNVDFELAEFYAPKYIYDNYKKALENPKIIHYAGRFIPCFTPLVDLAQYFWKYARMTPYYELTLSIMINEHVECHRHLQSDGNRTGARKVADFFFPKGTKRREILKKIIPKGSRGYAVLKQIYYVFNPKLKRPMHEDIKQNIR